MKSSYICRTFSSTTVLLVSFLSSSQASQNIMFSSLNSVLRNCLKQLRPAALFITLSKDTAQERASSSVGFGLGKMRECLIFTKMSKILYTCWFYGESYLSSQLAFPSGLGSNVDLCMVSSSLLTVKLGRKILFLIIVDRISTDHPNVIQLRL